MRPRYTTGTVPIRGVLAGAEKAQLEHLLIVGLDNRRGLYLAANTSQFERHIHMLEKALHELRGTCNEHTS